MQYSLYHIHMNDLLPTQMGVSCYPWKPQLKSRKENRWMWGFICSVFDESSRSFALSLCWWCHTKALAGCQWGSLFSTGETGRKEGEDVEIRREENQPDWSDVRWETKNLTEAFVCLWASLITRNSFVNCFSTIKHIHYSEASLLSLRYTESLYFFSLCLADCEHANYGEQQCIRNLLLCGFKQDRRRREEHWVLRLR